MIKGSIVAIITPMKQGGKPDTALDLEALERLVEFHIDNNTDGIVTMGTTGESATFMEQEHCFVIKRTVEIVNGRIPVIAGTGANSTTEAINLTRCAKEAGADGCLLVTPYYNKPTQDGLYQHFKTVAEAVSIPQILYNVPSRTACDMLPATVARLSEIPNIVGIKEATGSIERAREILALCGDSLVVLSGDDATAVDLILNGARGTISVTANVAPRQLAAAIAAAMAGDAEKAKTLDAPLAGLHANLFLEANPIPVKWALREMGKIQAGIRLPLTELDAQYHDQVRDALRQAGVLN